MTRSAIPSPVSSDGSQSGARVHDRAVTTIGWIGLGDLGAPMAEAVSAAGFALHVWARRRGALDALAGVAHVPHETIADLARASHVLALCLREDADITQIIASGDLWNNMRPGSVLVNHATGLPQYAATLADRGAEYGHHVLDAPVSGGRPAAVARELTTIVGGDAVVLEQLKPLFGSFSKKIIHMGGTGAGQTGKLLNNALLMMNQRSVQHMLKLAVAMKLNIPALVALLLSGSGASFALESLGSAVTPANADHLRDLQVIDMDLFREAMAGSRFDADDIYVEALEGANGLPDSARLVHSA